MKNKFKHQRKSQIMNAALSVAVEKGYYNSRMDDIVKKSNLSKGAIYWYYKSKKDVYLELVDHWFKQYSSDVLIKIESKKTASDKLNALFQYFSSQFVKNQSVFRILSEFWSLSKIDPDFNDKLQKVYKVFLDYIIIIIKEGIALKEFKNVDPRITALSILINLEGIHWFTLFEKSGVEAKEYISTISDFILSGLIKGLKNESN
jgi:AcrR family transcriptional regulator|tara:strand:- start:2487 stop:3098 length:612 start_codon:yes stop_codon:yes gene_type:complete